MESSHQMDTAFKLSLALILSSAQLAYADGFFIMPEVGQGSSSIKSEYRVSEDTKSESSTALSLLVGYHFNSNIILSGAAGTYYANSLFGSSDRIHIYDASLIAGYSFNIARHFRVVPMVGMSYWEMKGKQGRLSTEDNSQAQNFYGVDPLAKINLEFPFGRTFALNTSYTYSTYEFGSIRALKLGFKFNL